MGIRFKTNEQVQDSKGLTKYIHQDGYMKAKSGLSKNCVYHFSNFLVLFFAMRTHWESFRPQLIARNAQILHIWHIFNSKLGHFILFPN